MSSLSQRTVSVWLVGIEGEVEGQLGLYKEDGSLRSYEDVKSEVELELAGGLPILFFHDESTRSRILPSAWSLVQPGSTVVAAVVDPLRCIRSDFQRIAQSLAADSPKTISHVFVHADGHLSASAPPSPAQTLSPSFSPTSSRRSSVVVETATRTLSPATSSSALSTYRSARSRDATPERSPRLFDDLSPPHSPAAFSIRSQHNDRLRRQPSQHQVEFDDEQEEPVAAPAPFESLQFRGLNDYFGPGEPNKENDVAGGKRRSASPAPSAMPKDGVRRHGRNGSTDASLLPPKRRNASRSPPSSRAPSPARLAVPPVSLMAALSVKDRPVTPRPPAPLSSKGAVSPRQLLHVRFEPSVARDLMDSASSLPPTPARTPSYSCLSKAVPSSRVSETKAPWIAVHPEPLA
ncbi:proteophosphoglycan ppg4 [Rhodotorula toruloides]|uniref:Proteophosphoglycan ppg4 n=1 Tax=Rhodotorula toruloides TaxID=5286 RepID=A0A511KR07_RHOTO|nr:proteophosphoglycan ppg4 [Rhodotorula toruloides]